MIAALSYNSPQSSPSVPTDLPTGEGASSDEGTSPLLQLPSRGTGSILLPLLFLFPSSFHTQLHGDLSCPFRCPRSSASLQQGLCEDCSICRCILDAIVGRDELHVLLFLHHLDSCPTLINLNLNSHMCSVTAVLDSTRLFT